MVKIPEFKSRLNAYVPLAEKISPYLRKERGRPISRNTIAKAIPADVGAPLPAADGETDRTGWARNDRKSLSGAAVGKWIRGDYIPDDRHQQWEAVTGVPLTMWSDDDLETFERGVGRLAGAVLGWHGLVRKWGLRGVIRVRPFSPPEATSPSLRLFPAGVNIKAPPDKQLVWLGCRARVHVPVARPAQKPDERRAWMIADYRPGLYVIDPSQGADGTAPPSRLPRIVASREGAGAEVVLPRGVPDYVWIPPDTKPGARFELDVIIFDLSLHPEVSDVFDALERRWLVEPGRIWDDTYQCQVRTALDTAASLLDDRRIRCEIYRQECEVVSDEETARKQGHPGRVVAAE